MRPIAAMTCLLLAIAGCTEEPTPASSTTSKSSAAACDAPPATSSDTAAAAGSDASAAAPSDVSSAGSPDATATPSPDTSVARSPDTSAAPSPEVIEDDGSAVVKLAIAQLKAYNAHDLDAFCAAYHDDVTVLDGNGKVKYSGIKTFRQKYSPMFKAGGFGATIDRRIVMAPHAIERESWFRTDPNTGQKKTGTILVRYTEKDGKIAIVQFIQ